MNPLPPAIWDRGQTYREYRQDVQRNGAVFDAVYRRPAYIERDLDRLRELPPLRVLTIAEDWCPDVYHTLPTWARMAEELSGWKLRVLTRDKEPEVMDHFLWRRKARRIPVYAFYDLGGWLQVWWSGRCATAQKALDQALAGRRFDELDPEERRRVRQLLDDGYEEEYRRRNLEEILALLAAFYHLA